MDYCDNLLEKSIHFYVCLINVYLFFSKELPFITSTLWATTKKKSFVTEPALSFRTHIVGPCIHQEMTAYISFLVEECPKLLLADFQKSVFEIHALLSQKSLETIFFEGKWNSMVIVELSFRCQRTMQILLVYDFNMLFRFQKWMR
jgi:hypothetical protein